MTSPTPLSLRPPNIPIGLPREQMTKPQREALDSYVDFMKGSSPFPAKGAFPSTAGSFRKHSLIDNDHKPKSSLDPDISEGIEWQRWLDQQAQEDWKGLAT